MREKPSALSGRDDDAKSELSMHADQKAVKGTRSATVDDEAVEEKKASARRFQTKCGAWPGAGAAAPLAVLTAFEPCFGPLDGPSPAAEDAPRSADARAERDDRERSEPEGKVGARSEVQSASCGAILSAQEH